HPASHPSPTRRSSDLDGGDILARGKVIASTKHFLADGGTDRGVDQGDAKIGEEELRDIHGAPYGPAIEEGVATVMASFSSWQGVDRKSTRLNSSHVKI